jgi:hypothetical protein
MLFNVLSPHQALGQKTPPWTITGIGRIGLSVRPALTTVDAFPAFGDLQEFDRRPFFVRSA